MATAAEVSSAVITQHQRRQSCAAPWEPMRASLSYRAYISSALRSSGAAASARVAGWQWCRVVGDLFSAPDDAVSDDPIVDVVRQEPAVAAHYLRIVMALNGYGAALVCAVCFGYLLLCWECSGLCDRPLRWWLLQHALLQLVQMPGRFVFLAKLQRADTDDRNILACVSRFTASVAWRAGKNFTVVTYGLFLPGIAWAFNAGDCSACPGVYRMTIFVILQSVAIFLVKLFVFLAMFPNDEPGVDGAPTSQGVSAQHLLTLPTMQFAPGVLEESCVGCAVCLSDYKVGEVLLRLPCGHHFHSQCGNKWLHRSKNCPLCRGDVASQGSSSLKDV